MKKILKSKAGFRISISLLIIAILFFSGNEYPSVSKSDQTYINSFMVEWGISREPGTAFKNFDEEVAFISSVQNKVLANITHKIIPFDEVGNVEYYYKNRTGECYDRAMLMEKIFSYYGFKFRHAFVYYGNKVHDPNFLHLFVKSTQSHALLEVKTKMGWMAIGTNANWIGISTNGKVLNISDLKQEFNKRTLFLRNEAFIGIPFWKEGNKFKVCYGLYSRSGKFFTGNSRHNLSFPSFSVFPDYNVKMILFNF
jgi:hypothetical protein